jgi:uncharacterized membrane protein
METNDESIMSLMTDLLGLAPNQLPERKIVPLEVSYGEDRIVIDSPGGKINTTLAYQDNFRSDQKIIDQNNLLTVVGPHTEIRMAYPYLFEGMAVSFAGALGIAVLLYFLYRKKRCAL